MIKAPNSLTNHDSPITIHTFHCLQLIITSQIQVLRIYTMVIMMDPVWSSAVPGYNDGSSLNQRGSRYTKCWMFFLNHNSLMPCLLLVIWIMHSGLCWNPVIMTCDFHQNTIPEDSSSRFPHKQKYIESHYHTILPLPNQMPQFGVIMPPSLSSMWQWDYMDLPPSRPALSNLHFLTVMDCIPLLLTISSCILPSLVIKIK